MPGQIHPKQTSGRIDVSSCLLSSGSCSGRQDQNRGNTTGSEAVASKRKRFFFEKKKQKTSVNCGH
jgi:hypothetical protein